jgi:hypothetical protein
MVEQIEQETVQDSETTQEEVNEATAAAEAAIEQKIAETFKDDDEDELELTTGDNEEKVADESAGSTHDTSEFTKGELEAAKFFKIDTKALGKAAKDTLKRLSDARSHIGKRESELGRQEQELTNNPDTAVEDTDTVGESQTVSEEKFAAEDFGDEYAVELNAMQQKIADLENVINAQADQDSEQFTDNFFHGLDDKIYPELGKGEVEINSSEDVARAELVDQANILLEVAERQGKELSPEKALDQALLLTYPEAKVNATKKSIRKKVSKRTNQITTPPRSAMARTASNPDGEAVIAAKIAETFGADFDD